MIFKIQRPLTSTEDIPLAYVYNKNRDIEFFMPFEAVHEWFEENRLKVYVEADYQHDTDHTNSGTLTIARVVEDERW